jgi:Transposase DNA-binding
MVAKNSKSASDCRSDDLNEQEEAQGWVERETVDGTFKDERLRRRFKTLLTDIGGAIGESLPFACQDWVNTKAAYRFYSNDRVDEVDILSGHFQATAKRFTASDGMVLVLQDTTEFTFSASVLSKSASRKASVPARTAAGAYTRFAASSYMQASQ